MKNLNDNSSAKRKRTFENSEEAYKEVVITYNKIFEFLKQY